MHTGAFFHSKNLKISNILYKNIIVLPGLFCLFDLPSKKENIVTITFCMKYMCSQVVCKAQHRNGMVQNRCQRSECTLTM